VESGRVGHECGALVEARREPMGQRNGHKVPVDVRSRGLVGRV